MFFAVQPHVLLLSSLPPPLSSFFSGDITQMHLPVGMQDLNLGCHGMPMKITGNAES